MTPFTIMTFNIQGAYYNAGINIWDNRAALNVRTIQKHAPDLIGFQELQEGNRAYYAEHLPGYAYQLGPLVARENDSGSGYHCAIYWRPERFQLLEGGFFYLNETPDAYALNWGVTQGRGMNWVRLMDKQSGITFLYMNTHLPHDSEEGRVKAAALILERAPELYKHTLPVIMTADFNTRAAPLQEAWIADMPEDAQKELRERAYLWDNVVYRTFLEGGFRDTGEGYYSPDDPGTNTFHGMKGAEYPQFGMRIDWILVRDGENGAFHVHDTQIVRDAEPPIYTSDHYPVVAQLELK
ncbi:MAG: endonuclease/exonuclease/phosphatase family protein [Anaerolineae bacterium]